MLKKPNFAYVFDDTEYTEEEENLLISRLAILLLEIEEEAQAA